MPGADASRAEREANWNVVGTLRLAWENPANRYEILKIVFDRFLIGLLLVFAGLVANCVLDRTKSDLATLRMVNERRLGALARAWTFVNATESRMKKLGPVMSLDEMAVLETTTVDDSVQDSIAARLAKDHAQRDSLLKAQLDATREASAYFDTTRFWLREEERNRLMAYIQAVGFGLIRGEDPKRYEGLREDAHAVFQAPV